MEPTLSDGDYVVAATRLWRPQIDRLIVVRHKDYGVLVKRVLQRSAAGYIISSDNPMGTDSRTFGEIPDQDVIGTVLFRVRRSLGASRTSEKLSKALSSEKY